MTLASTFFWNLEQSSIILVDFNSLRDHCLTYIWTFLRTPISHWTKHGKHLPSSFTDISVQARQIFRARFLFRSVRPPLRSRQQRQQHQRQRQHRQQHPPRPRQHRHRSRKRRTALPNDQVWERQRETSQRREIAGWQDHVVVNLDLLCFV